MRTVCQPVPAWEACLLRHLGVGRENSLGGVAQAGSVWQQSLGAAVWVIVQSRHCLAGWGGAPSHARHGHRHRTLLSGTQWGSMSQARKSLSGCHMPVLSLPCRSCLPLGNRHTAKWAQAIVLWGRRRSGNFKQPGRRGQLPCPNVSPLGQGRWGTTGEPSLGTRCLVGEKVCSLFCSRGIVQGKGHMGTGWGIFFFQRKSRKQVRVGI